MTLNTVFWFVPVLMVAILKLVLPIAAIRRVLSRWLMTMAENWIAMNAIALRGSGSRDWQPSGADDLHREGWYLLMSNHQTWVDIVVLQAAFNRRIPLLKFFIKHVVWAVHSDICRT